jgi:hypothetical protein
MAFDTVHLRIPVQFSVGRGIGAGGLAESLSHFGEWMAEESVFPDVQIAPGDGEDLPREVSLECRLWTGGDG